MPTDQADAYSYAANGDKRMPVLFVAQQSGGLASLAEAWYFPLQHSFPSFSPSALFLFAIFLSLSGFSLPTLPLFLTSIVAV